MRNLFAVNLRSDDEKDYRVIQDIEIKKFVVTFVGCYPTATMIQVNGRLKDFKIGDVYTREGLLRIGLPQGIKEGTATGDQPPHVQLSLLVRPIEKSEVQDENAG